MEDFAEQEWRDLMASKQLPEPDLLQERLDFWVHRFHVCDEKPSIGAVQYWCDGAEAAMKQGELLPETLGSALTVFASMNLLPTDTFIKQWKLSIEQAIADKALTKTTIQRILHGCGVLKITPTVSFITVAQNMMEKHYPLERSSGAIEATNLMDLAMIDSYRSGLVDTQKVSALLQKISRHYAHPDNNAVIEQMHTAARYFGDTATAEHFCKKLTTDNTTESGLQRDVADEFRKQAGERSGNNHSGFNIHIREEAVHPTTGTPIDIKVEVRDRDGNDHDYWVQVDGPYHFLRSTDGTEIPDGRAHLQNKLAARNPDQSKFTRLDYKDLFNKKDIATAVTKSLDEAVCHALGEGKTKRPRKHGFELVSRAPSRAPSVSY